MYVAPRAVAWRVGLFDEYHFLRRAEQLIKDRAEFAQKGIARGRSIVAAIYDKGVILVAENPSASLNKVSEIYDRIAFAGRKYNEFDRS